MHFIFGGRCMGKLAYAISIKPDAIVCDLASADAAAMLNADIINNIHLFVKEMVLKGESSAGFFTDNLERLQGKILIGDEIGSGIVPMEPLDREWRDETGRVYQLLAGNASQVTRIWAGIPQVLKREGLPV